MPTEARPAARGVPPLLALLSAVVLRLLILLVGVVALGAVLSRLRLVVIPLLVALILATFLAPPAEALRQRRVPRALAATCVLVPALVVLGLIGWLLASQVVSHLSEVGLQVEEGLERVETWLADGPLGLSQDQIDDVTTNAADRVRSNWAGVTAGVFAGAIKAVELVGGLLLSLVILFLFLKDGDRMVTFFVELLPDDRQEDARAVGRRSWEALTGFIRGAAADGLIEAVLVAIALSVLGVPLAIPLAGITFLAGFFPVAGAILAGAVAALVALVAGGVGDAIAVVIVFTIVQQLQNNLLEPLILGRAVSLHPIVILLALTTGAVLGGLVGAFFSVPVVAVTAAALDEARTRGLFAAAARSRESGP